MNEPRGPAHAVIIGLIVLAGALTWLIISFHGSATHEATPATSSAPPGIGPPAQGTSSKGVTTPGPVGPQVTDRGAGIDQLSPDQRQLVKITRGLSVNPGGGLLVESLPPGSVASQLRVQVGDVIVSVNGHPIASPEEFARLYRDQGLPRQLTVIHNGREMHRH